MLLPLCQTFKSVVDRLAPAPPPPQQQPQAPQPQPMQYVQQPQNIQVVYVATAVPMAPMDASPLPKAPYQQQPQHQHQHQQHYNNNNNNQHHHQHQQYRGNNNNSQPRNNNNNNRQGSGGRPYNNNNNNAGNNNNNRSSRYEFPTAEKVHNRLQWDTLFRPIDFEVGVRNAPGAALEWVSLSQFKVDVTPFHTVACYRYKGQDIVWSKEDRIDTVDQLAQKLLQEARGGIRPQAPLMPEMEAPRVEFKPLVGSYPLLEPLSSTTPTEPNENPLPKTFSIMTWNVKFNLFDEKNNLRSDERLPLQLKALEECNADIIALQEVTDQFWKTLADQPFIKNKYYMTHLPMDVVSGQVILSKFKLQDTSTLRLSVQKHAILGRLKTQVGRTLLIFNIHLISDHAANATQRRLQEIGAIGKNFNVDDDIALLGDFNFCDKDPEESSVPWGPFLDVWHILHGSEPGYTIDYDKNSLCQYTCVRKESRRLDRIIVRGLLVPRDIHVYADVPNAQGLYPSDHFAVKAILVQEEEFIPFVPPVALDQQAAIVILPPQQYWEQIDQMRKLQDTSYPRWMPHIPLLHPFIQLSTEQVPVVAKALAAIATRFVPFRVRLRDFVASPCHSRAWLHLFGEALPPFEMSLYRLFAMLASTYTMCARDSYAPHLTVGQFPAAEVEKARAQFLTSWRPIVFDVTHIHIIARPTRDDAMNILHSIPLGSFLEPPVFPSPLAAFEKRTATGDIPSEPLDPPPMVMEPARPGQSRGPEPYWPKDALETWMLTANVMEYARTYPSHISQRGGMYHIPANMLRQFMTKWDESIKDSDTTPFCIEEVRSETFRLYVDVDFKSLQHSKIELEKSNLVPVLLTHTAACFPGADLTVCITECHGKWDDKHHTDAVYKSGYRFYFQHIWVDSHTFRMYLDSLAKVCEELVPPIQHLPRTVTWPEIVNTHSAIWERCRLIGTIKRRKNLWRRYKLFSFVRTSSTDVEKYIEKRAKETLLPVVPAREYQEEAKAVVQKLLFSTMVRYWDTADCADAVTIQNNVYSEGVTYTAFNKKINDGYMQKLLVRERRRRGDSGATGGGQSVEPTTPSQGREDSTPALRED
eukprot:PhF_6_TR955/c3_g1_i1/m.1787